MTSGKPRDQKVILSKAETYSHLCWLGIFFVPLDWIFCAITFGKVREAEAYGFNEDEEALAKKIRSNARNITITLTVLWIMGLIIYCSTISNFMNNAMRVRR